MPTVQNIGHVVVPGVGVLAVLATIIRRKLSERHITDRLPRQPAGVPAAQRSSGTPITMSRSNSYTNQIKLRAETPGKCDAAEPVTTGILVHGCHLEADQWEYIVWGQPPHLLGRIPHACLLAWEERQSLRRVICGTGASRSSDNRTEAEVTVDLLFERLPRLREFDGFDQVDFTELSSLLRRTVRAECESQNTMEEVSNALRAFQHEEIRKAVLVSSPTHLPRCLASAGRVNEQTPQLYDGSVWASPSDTSYAGSGASDLVVVEPPHRGDRDRSLDALPFHEMVRRSYGIVPSRRAAFLRELDRLLHQYAV